jgi:hypothetical protein
MHLQADHGILSAERALIDDWVEYHRRLHDAGAPPAGVREPRHPAPAAPTAVLELELD